MSHDPDKTGEDLSQATAPPAEPQESTVDIDSNAPRVEAPDSTLQLHQATPPLQESDQTLDSETSRMLDGPASPDATLGVPSMELPERIDGTLDIDWPESDAGGKTRQAGTGGTTFQREASDRTGAWNDGSDRTGAWGDEDEAADRTGAWEGAKTGAPARDHDTEHMDGGKKAGKGALPSTVAGYEILGELGRGGMGVVYKARQPGLNRLVALKMVLAGTHASPEQLARFQIEGEAVARLQHPNIVQVYELGKVEDCPFQALEFIDGDSLTRKIDATPQPPIEAAKMVRKLSQAMHAAHQRGIIHRDLKPANILLTREGEPKITDFGLAKRFEDDADDGHTRDGAIMGTPSYMAPEQAEGKTKHTGPPADIYALGSILYDLITGRPPFRGTTLLETLQQVKSMEPPPPARLQPGVPRDLETICLKSLEKDPRKRYATAGDLAEDLRRFIEGEPILARPTPWWERTIKWARRKPAVAALIGVGALALVSLLTFGGLWLDAERRSAEEREIQQARLAQSEREKAAKEEQLRKAAEEREQEKALQALRERKLRQSAEQNFKRAQQAVDFMLSKVGQERLAHVPQMQNVRRELLMEALKLYGEFQKEKGSDPDVRWQAGQAMQRVADIQGMLGRPRDAVKPYLNAIATFRDLANAEPEQSKYRKHLAGGIDSYATLLKQLKNNRAAEKLYREAMEIRKELARGAPKEPDMQRALAKSHNNLGVVLLGLGKYADAVKDFASGLAILRTLLKHDASDASCQEELARALNNQGAAFKAMIQPDAAQQKFVEARDKLAALDKANPGVPEYRQQLAVAWNHLGDLWRDKKPKEAEDAYEQARAARARLVKDFDSVPAYREELAQTYASMSILFQSTGRPTEAAEAQKQALEIQAKAVADFAHLPELRAKLASSHNNRGIVLLTQHKLKESEESLRTALKIFGDLTKEFPDVPFYQQELAGTHMNLGTLFQVTGRMPAAEKANRQALSIRNDLATRFPESPEFQRELGAIYLNLATLQQALKNHADAEKSYGRAIEVFTTLTNKHPDEPDYRRQLADSHGNFATLQRAEKKDGAAAKSTRAAVALYERLVQDFPLVPEHSLGLGEQLNKLAIVQAQTESVELAEKTFRQAITMLERQAPRKPLDPRFTQQLIELNRDLGNLLKALNKLTEEEKCVQRVLDLHEEIIKAYPGKLQLRHEAGQSYAEIATRLLQAEKSAAALKYLRAGTAHLQAGLKANPGDEASKQLLYGNFLNTAFASVQIGDHRQTAKALAAAAAFTPAKGAPHQVEAAMLARAAGLAAKDKMLSAAEAKELPRLYGDLAMKRLVLAVTQGFNDAAFLEKTPDFEPIRQREDFRMLVAKLRGVVKKDKSP
ncbi:MAG: tetratricopeptide repeat protein [Planctomycetes bacterium]|nr:tetratricopeptide repeat protein [Planctomycetota bacterium]